MNSTDTATYAHELDRLRTAFDEASAIVVGAGAGLSTAAGLAYSGKRFERLFGDFIARYGLRDMYSAGFYPFPTLEEQWAYWSRHIWYNRYEPAPKDTYAVLHDLVRDRNYFAITTNVDHQFQRAGFSKSRLFYTQGDYGLWQCSVPCHAQTYDNRDAVERMVREQKGCRIPTELVPHCPICGKPMAMNLRCDDTFVEDAGWHAAQERYARFLDAHETGRVLYLELGVGANTPVIIKYPFWRRVLENPEATYACLNFGEAFAPREIEGRSIVINADTDRVLRDLARV